jgi:hypothetical protein
MRFGAAKRIPPAAKPQILGFRAGCEALADDATHPTRVLYLIGPSYLTRSLLLASNLHWRTILPKFYFSGLNERFASHFDRLRQSK